MTLWFSDTCKCALEFDDTNDDIVRVIRQCNTHKDKKKDKFKTCKAVKHNIDTNTKIKAQFPPNMTKAQQAAIVKGVLTTDYIN